MRVGVVMVWLVVVESLLILMIHDVSWKWPIRVMCARWIGSVSRLESIVWGRIALIMHWMVSLLGSSMIPIAAVRSRIEVGIWIHAHW